MMTPTIPGDLPPMTNDEVKEVTKRTSTLALENRPKTWAELVGQPVPTTVLVNSLTVGDIKPGYVFAGTTGCGKTSAAQLLAKRLNCESPNLTTQDPCNTCRSCLTTEAGTNPDVKMIDGAADRSVDFVRNTLKPFLMTAPQRKCRVVVIDEAHLYGKDAISAFLTLLETLPKFAGRSVVVLTTTEIEKIDPAIMNRCMSLPFASIPNDLLAERMALYTGEDIEALRLLADEAGNSFRALWAYIEVWQHLREPLTPAVVMKIVGGISPQERELLWADLAAGRVDKVGERWRKWLSASGARPKVVGALLLRDLIAWAGRSPDSINWREPLRLLAGAQQVGSDSAWLQALYLMVGLPLDAHESQRQGPAERQPQLFDPVTPVSAPPAEVDVVAERLLFFGA